MTEPSALLCATAARRTDLADVMVELAKSGDYIKQAPMVANTPA